MSIFNTIYGKCKKMLIKMLWSVVWCNKMLKPLQLEDKVHISWLAKGL